MTCILSTQISTMSQIRVALDKFIRISNISTLGSKVESELLIPEPSNRGRVIRNGERPTKTSPLALATAVGLGDGSTQMRRELILMMVAENRRMRVSSNRSTRERHRQGGTNSIADRRRRRSAITGLRQRRTRQPCRASVKCSGSSSVCPAWDNSIPSLSYPANGPTEP